MFVYCVFSAHGEGDSYTEYTLLGICATVESCSKVIDADYERCASRDTTYWDPVEPSMNKANRYTYVGKREDCNGHCNYNNCGGYVIEQTKVIE